MQQQQQSMDPIPEIPILLLGDSGVGKSTFLSRLTLGDRGHKQTGKLPTLHDLDQPFSFNVRLFHRPYNLAFSDTASPLNYTLLRPAVIILCYSIAHPETLTSLQTYWKEIVEGHFNYDESIPVVVLGLQRDVRNRSDYDGRVRRRARDDDDDDNNDHNVLFDDGSDREVLNPRTFVYPQEALRIAQEMRCDRYCECSAVTGELCREVFEDITRTAAMTTTSKGGRSDGTICSVM